MNHHRSRLVVARRGRLKGDRCSGDKSLSLDGKNYVRIWREGWSTGPQAQLVHLAPQRTLPNSAP